MGLLGMQLHASRSHNEPGHAGTRARKELRAARPPRLMAQYADRDRDASLIGGVWLCLGGNHPGIKSILLSYVRWSVAPACILTADVSKRIFALQDDHRPFISRIRHRFLTKTPGDLWHYDTSKAAQLSTCNL